MTECEIRISPHSSSLWLQRTGDGNASFINHVGTCDRFYMKRLFGCLALLLITSCSEKGVRLEEADLIRMLEQERTAGFSSLRYTGTVLLRTDRSATLNIPALGEDTGRWWIEGNKLCSKWTKALNGNAACAYIDKLPDGNFAVHDPKTSLKIATFTLIN